MVVIFVFVFTNTINNRAKPRARCIVRGHSIRGHLDEGNVRSYVTILGLKWRGIFSKGAYFCIDNFPFYPQVWSLLRLPKL